MNKNITISEKPDFQKICHEVREVSQVLAEMPAFARDGLLLELAERLKGETEALAAANQKDLAGAQDLSPALRQRATLDLKKIAQLSTYPLSVAKLPDPLGRELYRCQLDQGLEVVKVTVPFGVIVAIFEARPEVVVQVAALALKSGNGLLLKGGSECRHTNKALFELIQQVLAPRGLARAVYLCESREDIDQLLALEGAVDLFVPRGSNNFVRYIQQHTRVPVLGHSDGICHVYIDDEADLNMAVKVALDAKANYPAACNAMETLLVAEAVGPSFLDLFLPAAKGIEIRGDEKTQRMARNLGYPVKSATEEDWRTEYGGLILSIRLVAGLKEALAHIFQYGSKHSEAIITENPHKAQVFMHRVDAACVYHNASTRFSDGFVFGLGAEVGISTNKIHARGPVGLEGLTSTKWLTTGNGHTKQPYTDGKLFLHQQ